jgi:hypothetical protein
VKKIAAIGTQLTVTLSEPVTVKGHPRLALHNDTFAHYASGSGSDTLVFTAHAESVTATKLDLKNGTVLATEATAALRVAQLVLP